MYLTDLIGFVSQFFIGIIFIGIIALVAFFNYILSNLQAAVLKIIFIVLSFEKIYLKVTVLMEVYEDDWAIKEKFALACCVSRNGDQNWYT